METNIRELIREHGGPVIVHFSPEDYPATPNGVAANSKELHICLEPDITRHTNFAMRTEKPKNVVSIFGHLNDSDLPDGIADKIVLHYRKRQAYSLVRAERMLKPGGEIYIEHDDTAAERLEEKLKSFAKHLGLEVETIIDLTGRKNVRKSGYQDKIKLHLSRGLAGTIQHGGIRKGYFLACLTRKGSRTRR